MRIGGELRRRFAHLSTPSPQERELSSALLNTLLTSSTQRYRRSGRPLVSTSAPERSQHVGHGSVARPAEPFGRRTRHSGQARSRPDRQEARLRLGEEHLHPQRARREPAKLLRSPEGAEAVVQGPPEAVAYTQHTQPTTVAAWSPSGYYIASGDAAGNVKVWDTAGGEQILKVEV